MWWQVLPPFAVIGGCMVVQFSGTGVAHYLFTGRPSCRGVTESTDYECPQKLAYKRDTFMTGTEYTSRGLDFIEDDD